MQLKNEFEPIRDWANQEIFKILSKYNSLKNDIYFLWKDFETVEVVFDHY